MPAPRTKIVLGLGLWVSLAGCAADEDAAPRPILSISSNPRLEPPPTLQDIFAAVDLAWNAGVRGQLVTETWSSLEPTDGSYSLEDLTNSLRYLGQERGFQIMLGIQVLNTTAKETPRDLLGVPFDAPQMKQRFHRLFDRLLPSLNPHVAYLSIGNEVDVYLTAHPSEWQAYRDFYEDALTYVHQQAPGLKVGVTATFDGATGPAAAEIERLAGRSDVTILTYYPLSEGLRVRDPGVAERDFSEMQGVTGSRPLVLQEVGYPTSARLGSSEELQAALMRNVFQQWGRHRERIPFLNVFLLHDLTDQICEDLTRYYGLPGNPAFKAFLCTLGLRQVDGPPKRAWQAFLDGAASMDLP